MSPTKSELTRILQKAGTGGPPLLPLAQELKAHSATIRPEAGQLVGNIEELQICLGI